MTKYTVIVHENGNRFWYLNEKFHREDGPAAEYTNGDRFWFLNGNLHREDGPAAEWANGNRYWYLNGEEVTEAEFNTKTNKSCDGKIIEIDGKKYQLKEMT